MPSFSNIGGAAAKGVAKGGLKAGLKGAIGSKGNLYGAGGQVLGGLVAKKKKKTGGAIGGAASGAGTGAMIGSVVPGIGTAAGAVVGGLIGGIKGWFSGKKKLKQEKEAKGLTDMAKKKGRPSFEGLGKPSDYMKAPPVYKHQDPRKG